MKTSAKIIIGALVILAIALVLVLQFSHLEGFAVHNTKKTVKVGIILPLTGSNALIGEGMRDAVLLAQENYKNTKYNYKIILEDDQLDPAQTATAANKLIGADQVNAIISVSSSPGNVVSPIAQQNKVLHISLASDANIAKGSYNFIDWTQPQEENRVFIQELQKREIKSVAVIRQNHPGAAAIVNNMKEQATEKGITIYEEMFNAGDKDFKTIIMKEKEKNPDIYFIIAYSPELEIIAKQIQELGITKPMTSIEAFDVTSQPELFEGMWYITAAEPNSEFRNAFKAKYKIDQTYGSANAYDAYNLIVAAFEASSKPNATEAADSLRNIRNFPGALGILNVDSKNIIQSKAVVKEIVNKTFVTISN